MFVCSFFFIYAEIGIIIKKRKKENNEQIFAHLKIDSSSLHIKKARWRIYVCGRLMIIVKREM